jgi:D-glycero-alpha-D-manno-heptose-7-phosphate kinase
MKRQLLRGRVTDYGRLLDQSWQLKRDFLPHTTSPALDRLYDTAKAAGALGGRLLGAGAGGFFLLQSAPVRRFHLAQALRAQGFEVKTFTFDSLGLQSWAVRESEEAP